MTLPSFRDPSLLRRALTHRSYLNENPHLVEDNQRLEFLGDAVLAFVVSTLLYHRFPEMKEGQLTRLRITVIRTERLAAFARQLEVGQQLRLGKGEEEGGGRTNESMLCDAFEAILGAYYLDSGIEAVRAFLEPLIAPVLEDVLRDESDRDAKSRLQEWAQAELHQTPKYQLVRTSGPEQLPQMTMEVVIGKRVYGVGLGRNKQIASQQAAQNALRVQRENKRRMLITGGAGYLGSHLAHWAEKQGWEVIVTFHTNPPPPDYAAYPLDLCDSPATQALLAKLQPHVIIHTACSNKTANHIAAIVPAATHLAYGAQATGARFIHVSSDMVFDGEHAPYSDQATTASIHPYGEAKAEAERLVMELCPSAAIVRPSLIWGLEPLDPQTAWLVTAVKNNQAVTLFTDEYRSPVYVHDLCAALLELAERPELSGLFNTGGAQALSRWEFGLRLLKALNITPSANLKSGLVHDSGLVRARNLSMISARAAESLKAKLRGVGDVLGHNQ